MFQSNGTSSKDEPKRIGDTYKHYATAIGESVLLAWLKVKEPALIPDLAAPRSSSPVPRRISSERK
ncbi:MAG: hypothetical protein LC753_19095 [Acidobacteria bacterium]|nr:hypothetical protein [Acidobacteriota bacterium]MCA1652271.1 hypothetical protein [Acidobacteriota bacterium]